MLKKPEQDVAEALHRLQAFEDWQTVLRWLEDSVEHNRRANDSVQDLHALGLHQGAIKALTEFLGVQEQAGDIARRYRDHKRSQ